MNNLKYRDLRGFLVALEQRALMQRVTASVSPRLEMTALADIALRQNGPALLFERPAGFHEGHRTRRGCGAAGGTSECAAGAWRTRQWDHGPGAAAHVRLPAPAGAGRLGRNPVKRLLR